MKKVIFLVIAVSIGSYLAAQTVPPPPPVLADSSNQYSKDTAGAFRKVEIEAKYPGGDAAWRKYLESNFKINKVSDAIWKDLPNKTKKKTGTIVLTDTVQFIVCKDGSLCEIKSLTNVPAALQEEAKRLITESKQWEPAIQDGKTVKAYRKQPITLVLSIE